jgi:hypothetical protein
MRFRCAACGTPTGDVVGGRELHVVRLSLAAAGEEQARDAGHDRQPAEHDRTADAAVEVRGAPAR